MGDEADNTMAEPKLDLITVNNFLVNLTKPIARSRVQIIHKMTRHMEQLQKKKGTEAQKSKNVRKVDRLRQEIQLMKTFKRPDIAKFAIINEEKFEEGENVNPNGKYFYVKCYFNELCHIGLRK